MKIIQLRLSCVEEEVRCEIKFIVLWDFSKEDFAVIPVDEQCLENKE